MITHLKRGCEWEYLEDLKKLKITVFNLKDPREFPTTIQLDMVGARSLGCFINRVAWHREKRVFKKKIKRVFLSNANLSKTSLSPTKWK